MRGVLRLLPFYLLTLAALAQSSPRTFEAAEIRINNSGGSDSRGDIVDGRLFVRNIALRYLIAEAWSVTQAEVIGPSWLDDIRVDVVAKSASPTTSDGETREMLQNLLKERMRLVEHQEQRELPAWALTVWKGQNKMKPSSMPTKPEDSSCTLSHDNAGAHLACQHLTMALLALKLPNLASSDLNMRVVDMTGLGGAWEIALDWMPQPRADTEGGLTLFAALQAQAGLQLTSRKLPSPVLVVDSMKKTPESQ
ncbi:MAG TPA: TIGR03435 family protein [Bryobacteraceae bacterium]|nr:TIGR03435 family protein [Bryobacteraceae bacterium]